MSRHDVHRGDMDHGDPTISAFSRDVRDAAASTPEPEIGPSLAAVLSGRSPAIAHPEVEETPRARSVHRRTRLWWAVGAAGALTVGGGSLGLAGTLPGPVQRQVSRMADVIGVDVPDGRDDAPVTPTIPPPIWAPPAASATDTSTEPPVGTTLVGDEQQLETSEHPEPEDGEDTRGRRRPGGDVDRDGDDGDEDADEAERVGHDTDDTDDLDDLDNSGRGSVDQEDDPTRDRSGSRSGTDVVDGSDGDRDDLKSSKSAGVPRPRHEAFT